ncbi:uncharacterized protein LOC132950329 isoform X2 [Metopolophium dirhodum]|uniref:uncharacterized protein LOC132950329 isoform X2 n=1 Tax=Metopolophium dirhodum TaxID=44670 RepID=UPI0029904C94|nr:uncharacterized protein LOC132950329 isoform X2 [Metopolophium dirhodum]
MAQGSNTSKFVKTYGKPRRTQLLGQNSLWNDDLNDDFDKCLGIEDVPQTTFISPEPSCSVTMYKPDKHKKKKEDQKHSIGGWSMQLHSTLDGHRNNLSTKKRYTEYNLDSNHKKKKLLLKSAQKKKENLNISNNSKGVTPISIKKLKNKFILSKEQCSTPLQKSMLFAHGNKFYSMSSKKKKKSKLKKNLVHAVNTLNSSKLPLQLEHSHSKNSNILRKINYEYNNPFDESIQISSSHFPPSKKKYSENSESNNQLFNSPNRLCRIKKKNIPSSKEKNSNWYQKVMDIFCDEESINVEKSKNQDFMTSEEPLNMCSFEPVLTSEIKQLKPLEQQKQSLPLSNYNNLSFQSLQHLNISSSENDNHSLSSLDRSKSNRKNSIITIGNIKEETFEESQPSQPCIHLNISSSRKNNHSLLSLDRSKSNRENSIITIGNIKEGSIEESQSSQPCILYNKYLSKCANSSYESCYQLDKSKAIEDSRLPNVDYVSVNSLNDEDVFNISNNEDYKLLQLNQYRTPSSCKNSTCMIQNKVKKEYTSNSYSLSQDYSKVSSADHLDFRLLNVLDRIANNKQRPYTQNNQTSLIPYENIGLQSDDEQFDCCTPDSESQILLDVTTKFSDIIIDDKIEQSNKSIKEESLFGKFDHTLDISLDTSNHKRDIISNNSSILQSSSSLEQDTVIYKQNCTIDMLHTKENAYYNNQLLNDKSFELKTHKTTIKCEENTSTKNQINISSSENDTNDILKTNESVFVPRRKRYAARFQSLEVIEEFNQLDTILTEENTTVFHLEPGKKWRRSISIVRGCMDRNMNESINFTKGRKWAYTVDDILRRQSINTSIHQNLNQSNIFKNSMCSFSQRYLHRTSIDTSIYQNLDQKNISKKLMCSSSQNLQITSTDLENQKARSYIFEVCHQKELISFESWLSPKYTNKWKKVGEGVYGEVFSYSSGNRCTIVKIIPIEGLVNINSEQQKKMFEVYSEIVIATELNKLWNKSNLNQTSSFCKLKRVSCVQGKYPSILIDFWQQYDNDKGSDNDNPDILPKDQMFMILEMENGGIDVESFVFNSADQSLFAFLQIVFGLAVAEEEYKFEHRDLHIGNILIKKCSNKKIAYELEGQHFNVPSRGIKITIIDYTLSRMTYNSNHIYNDLAKDTELFTSVGDYQFDIYRMMRKETNDQWELFKPATNIYWLHYVLDKMLMSVHYKKTNTILHSNGLSNLERLKNVILSFNSAKGFAESELILDLIGYKKP